MFLRVPAGPGCGPFLNDGFRIGRNSVAVDSLSLRRLALARRKIALALGPALTFKRAIDGAVQFAAFNSRTGTSEKGCGVLDEPVVAPIYPQGASAVLQLNAHPVAVVTGLIAATARIGFAALQLRKRTVNVIQNVLTTLGHWILSDLRRACSPRFFQRSPVHLLDEVQGHPVYLP